MASGTISGSYRGYTLRSVWNSTPNTEGNYSDIIITHYLDCAPTYALYIPIRYNVCTCGDTQAFDSPSISTEGNQTITLGTTSHRVNHNEDGSKQETLTTVFNMQAYISGVYVDNITASGTITLDNIPRYTSITTFSASKVNETSLKINWATTDIIDQLKYRYKQSGGSWSSWVTSSISDKKSGNFTVYSLNSDTTYNFQLKVRRKDSQLITDSTTDAVQTTYSYPYISSVASSTLTIGNSQTLSLYNPLARTVTINMYQNNTSGTQLYSGTTNGNTFTFTPNANTLYNSIPNSTSGTCVYSVVYSSSTKTTGQGTYQIKGDELPTFSASNWTYTADKTNLTNTNQTIINKYSTITINVGTAATSSYGATISKYIIKWGNATNNTTTTSGTITNGSGQTLIVTAVDSRNLSRETSKTISNNNYANYTDLSISEISTNRNNGIETGVKLNLSGSMFNGKFGNSGVTNALSYAKYYVSTNGTSWSSAYPSDNSMLNAITKSGGMFTLSDFVIHANGSSGGFTIGTQYYVKVEIKDASNSLSTVTTTSIVTNGKVARTVYQDSNGNYHEGINGLPNDSYTETINGSLYATGNTKIDGVLYTGSNGREDYSSAGFTYDQYGNMKHKRNTNTDAFSIQSYDGTNVLKINPETGVINLKTGSIDANGNLSTAAPKSHASSTTTYGVGTTGNYGHCKLVNNLTTSSYADGVALAGNQGKVLNDAINNLKPVQLYNNATGSNSTITLSQSAANFTYIEIFYKETQRGNCYSSVNVYSPNDKTVNLSTMYYSGATYGMYLVTKDIKISGTSITNVRYGWQYVGSDRYSVDQNLINIVRVVGYK